MMISTLTQEKYAKCDNWITFFKKGKTLCDIPYDLSWVIMFRSLIIDKDIGFDKIEKYLKEQTNRIYPHPEYLFSAFLITPADELKVVILGQDPYFNCNEAMGLSFSVPHNVIIPSSLKNIYSNLLKYRHIKNKSNSGNLWFWSSQGCLMLNASLTVEDGKKNSHKHLWKDMTNGIIKYISTYMKDIVFIIWGNDAYNKVEYINRKKHHLIISSHPSGLSANKSFKEFPSFMDCDCFGKTNEILKSLKKNTIVW